jgi:hypothetical protein
MFLFFVWCCIIHKYNGLFRRPNPTWRSLSPQEETTLVSIITTPQISEQIKQCAQKVLLQTHVAWTKYLVYDILEHSNSMNYKQHYSDLLSAGYSGLIRASKTFRGKSRFTTYSYHFIRSAIFQTITKLSTSILTHKEAILWNKMKREKYRLTQERQETVSWDEVITRLHISPKTAKYIMTKGQRKQQSWTFDLPAHVPSALPEEMFVGWEGTFEEKRVVWLRTMEKKTWKETADSVGICKETARLRQLSFVQKNKHTIL